MSATLFTGGTIWTGDGETDALLVVDGVVAALGDDARDGAGADTVDLDGGFLMPSFGDGHAHPLYGGLEAVGPPVRPCHSVDEIVSAVGTYAAEHPDEEWIVGASYDGSLAPDGLFDARWLDAAVPDRPVVLRAWDYHTVWCNSEALRARGHHRRHPRPGAGRDPAPRRRLSAGHAAGMGRNRSGDGRDAAPRRATSASTRCGTAADYYLARGVTWVQDAWVEPADVDTYVDGGATGRAADAVQPRAVRRPAPLRFAGRSFRRAAAPGRRGGLDRC